MAEVEDMVLHYNLNENFQQQSDVQNQIINNFRCPPNKKDSRDVLYRMSANELGSAANDDVVTKTT